jgi:ferritin-like metal-binding protein YciE
MAAEFHEQLTKYLVEAHSIEVQALAQLRTAPEIAVDPDLSAMYRKHLIETEGHERMVRSAIEARGAQPSRTKDAVMALGGKGFVLFARLQADTPGKLHAHALSYEALELASYELLGRVAARAGEPDVAELAERIAVDERTMMERFEASFDRAVESSLREVGRDDLKEQLRRYLADAHAIEEQAIALLERGPALAGSERLAAIYDDHLGETREHAETLSARLDALGGDPSSLKDAALRLGALNWAAFFRGHPDTPGKLACFVRGFEYLEIGGYEQLERVARLARDEETARQLDVIIAQERAVSERVAGAFGDAVQASLDALEVSN